MDDLRKYFLLFLVSLCFLGLAVAQENRRYALIWHDEFNESVLDKNVWSKIWRGRADWMIHMSSDERLYALEEGDLVLRGMANDFLPKDTAAFLTGGVWSRNRKAFGFEGTPIHFALRQRTKENA